MAKLLDIGEYSGTKLKEVVRSNFACSVTTYEAQHFDNSRHFHPNTHLSFVLRGGCEEQKKNAYHRKPFSSTFYYPGEEHQINHIKDQSIHVNIEFEEDFFNDLITEEAIEKACKTSNSMPFLMTKIYRELYLADNLTNLAIENLALSIFGTEQKLINITNIPLWVNIAKDYIVTYWNKTIQLDELAKICGVHKITVSKYFSKYTGYSITDFQRQIRIKKALELMESKKTSLTDVAFQCGFADQSHFIRFFKQYLGYLPKQFQNLQR